jgi:hypothetical protein
LLVTRLNDRVATRLSGSCYIHRRIGLLHPPTLDRRHLIDLSELHLRSGLNIELTDSTFERLKQQDV